MLLSERCSQIVEGAAAQIRGAFTQKQRAALYFERSAQTGGWLHS
jgi:hypothetical protein